MLDGLVEDSDEPVRVEVLRIRTIPLRYGSSEWRGFDSRWGTSGGGAVLTKESGLHRRPYRGSWTLPSQARLLDVLSRSGGGQNGALLCHHHAAACLIVQCGAGSGGQEAVGVFSSVVNDRVARYSRLCWAESYLGPSPPVRVCWRPGGEVWASAGRLARGRALVAGHWTFADV
jgi:hypothetical protein